MYLDSHNHLQDPWLSGHVKEIATLCQSLPIPKMIVNGTTEADWDEIDRLADRYEFVVPSYGLHPWFLEKRTSKWRASLERRLEARPSAIGEVGLDRWKQGYDFPVQLEILKNHLEVARELHRPITIHCLQAWGPLLKLLENCPPPKCGFLLHAYGGSSEMASRFAALGAYFSFSGYFLSPGKESKRAVFRHLPGDRVLAETDAPAMPLPLQSAEFSLPPAESGQPVNHPANIRAVYRGLAEIRDLDEPSLATLLNRNFKALFGKQLSSD